MSIKLIAFRAIKFIKNIIYHNKNFITAFEIKTLSIRMIKRIRDCISTINALRLLLPIKSNS